MKQAQEQIAIQVNEVLPVPLAKHAEESRQLIGEVQNALANSYVEYKQFQCEVSQNISTGRLAARTQSLGRVLAT